MGSRGIEPRQSAGRLVYSQDELPGSDSPNTPTRIRTLILWSGARCVTVITTDASLSNPTLFDIAYPFYPYRWPMQPDSNTRR